MQTEEQQRRQFGCTIQELEDQYFILRYERVGYGSAVLSLLNDAAIEVTFDTEKAIKSINKAKYIVLKKLDKFSELEASLEKIKEINRAKDMD